MTGQSRPPWQAFFCPRFPCPSPRSVHACSTNPADALIHARASLSIKATIPAINKDRCKAGRIDRTTAYILQPSDSSGDEDD